MSVYLLNAFSLNMLSDLSHVGQALPVQMREISLAEAAEFAVTAKSFVGHAETAHVFGSVLGVPVELNRGSVQLSLGDQALVGQYMGPRLAEGATSLPPGAEVRWFVVEVLLNLASTTTSA